MIEKSVDTSKRGADSSGKVSGLLDSLRERAAHASNVLDSLTGRVRKVNASMGNIRDNSHEQHSGIGEVAAAVEQINEVTQRNAQGATEAASASEELNAQVMTLRQIVQDLDSLIHGQSNQSHPLQTESPSESPSGSPRGVLAVRGTSAY